MWMPASWTTLDGVADVLQALALLHFREALGIHRFEADEHRMAPRAFHQAHEFGIAGQVGAHLRGPLEAEAFGDHRLEQFPGAALVGGEVVIAEEHEVVPGVVLPEFFQDGGDRAIAELLPEHARHRTEGAVERAAARGLHHHGLPAADHAVGRSPGQGEIRHRQRIQVGDPGRQVVMPNDSRAILPREVRHRRVPGVGRCYAAFVPEVQQRVHRPFAFSAHDEVPMPQRFVGKERDMRPAQDDRYAARAAFIRQRVSASRRGGDGRDAHHVRLAVFRDPGLQIEALPALDKHPRVPAVAAIHQPGQDEAPQPRQGELGEDVELRARRLNEQHETFHEQSPFRSRANIAQDILKTHPGHKRGEAQPRGK